MRVEHCASWESFEAFHQEFFNLSHSKQSQYLFRGQARSRWKLEPSLDRGKRFGSPGARDAYLHQVLRHFREQVMGLEAARSLQLNDPNWELIARHHGMRTSILDWTRSPYIAAFFAFADPVLEADAEEDGNVAVWVLNRRFASRLVDGKPAPIAQLVDIFDDPDHYRYNVRAFEQQAVFLQFKTAGIAPEDFGTDLVKLTLPRALRRESLSRLMSMRISYRDLFRDFDHAARTAMWLAEEGLLGE